MAVGYFVILIISQNLGAKAVGLYSLYISFLSILGVLSAVGLGMISLKYAGEFKADSNNSHIKRLYKLTLEIVFPVGLFIAFLVFLFSDTLFEIFFKIDGTLFLSVLVSIMVFAFALFLINVEYLRALDSLRVSEFFKSSFIPVLILVSLYLLLSNDTEFLLPIYLYSTALFFAVLIMLVLIFRRFSELVESKDRFTLTKKQVLLSSLPLLMVSFGVFLMSHVDNFIIAYYLTPNDVGIYAVAFKVAFVTGLVLVAVNTVVAVRFSELYSNNDIEALKATVGFSTTLVFFGTLPLAVIIIIFPEFILSLFGAEFIGGQYSLVILAFAMLLTALSGSVGHLLVMTGSQLVVQNVVWSSLLLNIVLDIVLVPSYGIEGAAIATALSLVFQNFLLVMVARKKLGINTFLMRLKT